MKVLNMEMTRRIAAIILPVIMLAACGGSVASLSVGSNDAGNVATTVALAAADSMVAYNGATTLTWSSSNATSCSSSPAGISGTSGTYTTPALTATTTYTVTCVGQNGSASKSVTISVAGTSIVSVAAACAAEPMRGTVYYYCDCGTGAEAGCVAGDDANSGTSLSSPRRTIGNAASRFASLAVNDTVALCKGGAFDSVGNLDIGSNRCGAGNACNDLREYTPTTFAGSAKPIINNLGGNAILFNFFGKGGIRMLNLKLKGDGVTNGNHAFMFYNGAHDVTMCNLDMDTFDLAVYNESGTTSNASNNNIKFTGNLVTNSRKMGYLGGGINDNISYNYWDGNGSSNTFDHTLYFNSSKELSNMKIVGNYVKGQYGSTCNGAPVVAHMAVDGLLFKDNTVQIDAAASTAGCWGVAFTNQTSAPEAIYHRNAVFSGNTIINGGNTAFTITGCPGCVIENNLIINSTSMEAIGISVAANFARTVDDVNTANIIRNNTIWFGSNAQSGGAGIVVGTEGGSHVVVNNSVTYTSTLTGNYGAFNCYNYPLALSSYAFINNNHCYSAAAYNWEASQGSLASWKTYSASSGFDTLSITGNPKFKAAGTNFVPDTGSPLIAAGDTVHMSIYDMSGKTRTSPPAIGSYEP